MTIIKKIGEKCMKNKQLLQILLISAVLICVATPIAIATTTQASTTAVSITSTPYASIVITASNLIMAIICGTAYVMILKRRKENKA